MTDDIIILKSSGVPLFAKCYGGSTCKTHPDHALQSGFLAALFSYSKETFSKQGIKSVIFSDFKLDFKIDEEKDLIIVFTNPLNEDDVIIKEQLEKTHKAFIDKFESKLDSLAFSTEGFYEFDQDLVKLNIVHNGAKKDVPLEKEPFWKKILSHFRRK
ncbi:MAG: hypothetical protein FK731_05225 [Asgard group archaeon]|nr:hypothetical protein [Asgard group archaeon]